MQKDTIYVDVDDEITSIIEKIRTSRSKIVALVLPKRAAMLQSMVNMKLLKRAADSSKKRIVLITSETSLYPLAGSVGFYVAKTLQSKPEIPPAPDMSDMGSQVMDAGEASDIDPRRSVGELAGLPPEDQETIEVDDTDKPAPGVAPGLAVSGATAPVAAAKAKKLPKFRVPDFQKFKLRLALGLLAFVLLIAGWIYAFMVAPRAQVLVKTNAQTVNSTLTLTVDAAAKELNTDTLLVPAQVEKLEKIKEEKVPTTGEKDVGSKASGSVTLINCGSKDVTIPGGTGVSSGNQTFIMQQTVSLKDGNFDSSRNCKTSGDHVGSVTVVAQRNGDQGNLPADTEYSVAGFPEVRGVGEEMTGGVTKLVKVVSETDIETAKAKIAEKTTSSAEDEMKKKLESRGLYAIKDSMESNDPVVTSTPKVGEEATEVTVKSVTNYTMLGVKRDDLKTLVENDIKKQIDTTKQSILDNGLETAKARVIDEQSDTRMKVSFEATAEAGPEIDIEALKQRVAGKKRGEVISLIKEHPGVEDVTVNYSPFWVTTTPKKAQKINIVFEQPSNNNAEPRD